jgi:adenylate cyclase
MAEITVDRKLRAILAADVKGYSRMMGEDEVGTYQTLTAYLESINSIISEHKGRVFSSPGDAVMAEFPSVVDAVQCAVELQENIEAANVQVPDDRKMQFRIGVNLGDVIHDGEQVYGDGVNIAARIETLAEPGGVSISRNVYDQVRNKLKFGYEHQGEHQVKNISEPVNIYKILTKPENAGQLIGKPNSPKRLSKQSYISIFAVLALIAATAIWRFYPLPPDMEPASLEKMVFPLPDKPSIAVLPFVNMSPDQGQEYFADGISENIISALSHIPQMFVIARNSTFTYKGKPVKVQQVSEELGVQYVLEGSIQRSGDQIRVTAQLIDATTGHHIWAERYDRKLKEIFALQDEITLKILTALQVELTEGEQARLWGTTDNLEAWGDVIKGSALFEQFTKQSNSRAQQFFEQAAKLDPNWDIAWTMLAWTHWAEARLGWSASPAESIKQAIEIAKKAAAINDTLPEVHSLWSNIYLAQGEYDKAISAGEKAIALGPNNALCHVLLAHTMTSAGRFEKAIELSEKALRLSPYSSAWYLGMIDDAYRMAGRYEEALAIGKQHLDRCLKGECEPFTAHMGLAATYVGLGRIEEARSHVTELLKIMPDLSLDKARKMISFKDPAHVERALDALRRAGLPE